MSKTKKSTSEVYKTILVITLGFFIIHFYGKWNWAKNVAIIIGISSVISVYAAEKISWVWDKIGWVLSLIVPNILLTIIFYLFLTPLSILNTIFGKKNQLNIKNIESSLFKNSNKQFTKEMFDNPW